MARFVKISTITLNWIPEREIDKNKPLYDSVIAYLDNQLRNVLLEKPDLIVLPEYCGRQNTFPERKTEYDNGENLRIFEYLKKSGKRKQVLYSFFALEKNG